MEHREGSIENRGEHKKTSDDKPLALVASQGKKEGEKAAWFGDWLANGIFDRFRSLQLTSGSRRHPLVRTFRRVFLCLHTLSVLVALSPSSLSRRPRNSSKYWAWLKEYVSAFSSSFHLARLEYVCGVSQ